MNSPIAKLSFRTLRHPGSPYAAIA